MLGHLFVRAKVVALLALPCGLRTPWLPCELGLPGGSHVLKQGTLDVGHVHHLSATFAQRRLELLEQAVVKVQEVVRVLNANRVKSFREALPVPRLDRVEPLAHACKFGGQICLAA